MNLPNSNKFPTTSRLGVIGGGAMAKSIIFPLFNQGALDPVHVAVAGNTEKGVKPWLDKGCSVSKFSENKGKIFEDCNVILWAVKPQVFPKAVVYAGSETPRDCPLPSESTPLHISVMGGITLAQFSQQIAGVRGVKSIHAIRTMPNIGHRVGAGCTVFALGPQASDTDRLHVQSLFSPTGLCLEVPEGQINGFSALSGSGVGFMCPVLEAMADGAVKVGIGREIALKMAAQTMKATAEIYLQEQTHPGAIKDTVCSPGGSTIAGISELEKGALRSSIINAVDAAYKRSEEIGKLL